MISAHMAALGNRVPKTQSRNKPLGGPRPLIGLSPATASPNTERWSDTNGEERESLLFLAAEEAGKWNLSGGNPQLGIWAKLGKTHPFPAETHG